MMVSDDVVVLHQPHRPNKWAKWGWFLLGAFTACAIIGGYFFWQAVQSILTQPYYVWQTSAMVIRYMEENQNRWPGSWDDLQSVVDSHHGNTNFKIEELREKVAIDWNADPKRLVKAQWNDNDEPAFRVIWLRNGRSIHWSSAEPNRLIYDYLQRAMPKSK